MIWTDNMLIPKGAANKYTAELMIDWVYDVDRAQLANFIYYISPVKGVAEAITELDPEAGRATRSSSRRDDVVAKQHPEQPPGTTKTVETEINGALRGPRRHLSRTTPVDRGAVEPMHRAPSLAAALAPDGAGAALAGRVLRRAQRPDADHVALDGHPRDGLRPSPGTSATTRRR